MSGVVVCPVCGRMLKRVNDKTPKAGGVVCCSGCRAHVRYSIEDGKLIVTRV